MNKDLFESFFEIGFLVFMSEDLEITYLLEEDFMYHCQRLE